MATCQPVATLFNLWQPFPICGDPFFNPWQPVKPFLATLSAETRNNAIMELFRRFSLHCLAHLYGQIIEIIALKAPGNHSHQFWFDKVSILLCAGQKTQIFMLSDFWTCPGPSKPTLFIFGDTRTPNKNQENLWGIFGKYYLCNSGNQKI